MYYIVKYEDNWADEMDVEGFYIFTELGFNYFNKLVTLVANRIDEEVDHHGWSSNPFRFFIGTNEELPYHSKEEFIGAFSVAAVEDFSDDLVFILGKTSGFGVFPDIEILEEYLADTGSWDWSAVSNYEEERENRVAEYIAEHEDELDKLALSVNS